VQSRPGQRRLVVTVSAGDAPRLVRVVGSSGPGRGRFRWTAQLVGPGVEGSATGFMADRGGTSSTTAGTVQPGQRVRVVVHASLGVRPGTLFGVSVSELVH
jgi:hypothetical protein